MAARTSPLLIVPYMWIGDFVRCHSVVKLLKALYPDRPIDVLTTTLCAPLPDYMPGVRKGIVVDLPRQRLGLGRAPRAGRTAARRALRQRPGHAADLEGGAGAVPRRHPERTGFVGEWRFGLLNDIRFGEAPAPHDRPLRRAGAAARRRAAGRHGRCPNSCSAKRKSRLGGTATASPTADRPRGARARRGRAVQALARLRRAGRTR